MGLTAVPVFDARGEIIDDVGCDTSHAGTFEDREPTEEAESDEEGKKMDPALTGLPPTRFHKVTVAEPNFYYCDNRWEM